MEKPTLNKWQEAYLRIYYDGKMPRNKEGKKELEVLGGMKEKVIIDFPAMGEKPAHTEEYIIRDGDCDMPNGYISVEILASNLTYWNFRGFTVRTE